MKRAVVVLLGLTLVSSLAMAATEETGHASDHGAAPSSSEIFGQLFGHLVPHAVTGIWIGGDKGFAVGVDPAKADGGVDSHGNPIPHGSSKDFTEARRAEFGGGFGLLVYNINTVQWFAGGLLLLVMALTARRARARGTEAPQGAWYGIIESTILYVRNEMVYPVLGKDQGRTLLPLFLTQFFFIFFMNLFGLLPDIGHSGLLGTATSNVMVTGGLALTSFVAIHAMGVKQFGLIKHCKNFVPHVPGFLVPLMIVVELVGVLVKPFALSVRLAANLTAGHLVVLGLFGLAYLAGGFLGYVPLVMAIAIYALELFVALVQAYIFTYLSIVFVGASLHPDH